jgi:hypothetical protein
MGRPAHTTAQLRRVGDELDRFQPLVRASVRLTCSRRETETSKYAIL